MELKRVVVTGLGAVTPLGNDKDTTWESLINGVSGAGPITNFDCSQFKTQFACEVKNLEIDKYFDRKEARKLDRYAQFSIVAAEEAVKDCELNIEEANKDRIGVIMGVGIGGMKTFEDEILNWGKCMNAGVGPKYNPFFIPKMIADTYTYGEEWHNVDRKWDPYEMLIPLHHLTFNTDGYVWMKIVKDRELSREREDIYTTKGRFVDAPESGSEVKADRSQAEDRPVIVLVGQKGAEEKGWRNTPFYWPTLTFPKDMQSGMFTLDGNKKFRAPKKPIKLDTLGSYPKEEVLKLTISRDDLFGIISGNQKEVSRNMKRTTASMFLAKDLFDNYILVEGTDPEKQYSLASYNDGVFPYEIRQYKYIHFRASMDMSGSQAIVKIEEENPYEMIAKQFEDFDVHYDANNQTTEVVDESKCFWRIVFYLGDVLETKFAGDDKDVYEAYLNNLRNS